MRLPKYPKYKPSGIEWLGEIPEHWEVLPIKRITVIPVTDGPHETPEFLDDGIPFISAEAIKNDKIDFSKKRGFISAEEHARFSRKYRPQKGDIYMVKSGATTGNVAYVDTDIEFNIWSPLAVIRPNKDKAITPYVFFFMKSRNFFQAIELSWSYGTQQNIGMNVIENLPIVLPPLWEQNSIAAFLDRETAKIDTLIEKKERQIELLQEKRAAIISHAVTKGLNPNVKMKDSGIEWLGEIPEHWELRRLKFATQILMGQSPNSNDYSYNSKGLPFLQGNAEFSQRHPVPRLICNTASKVAPAAALLISVRAPVGALNVADREYAIGRGLCAIIPAPLLLDQQYSWYLLQIIREELFSVAKGSTYDAVTADEVANLRGVIPPPNEQRAIAAFLDRETARIDSLIEKIRKSIDLLREYRTALITAAVTGKIDVREEVLTT